MIDKTFITAQAIRWQTAQRNVIREYCQHAFLSVLYKQKEANALFFKGGTALRILFESPRFSEDLDFSSPVHSVNALENVVQEALIHLAHEGIHLDISEAKPTTGGYLFHCGYSAFKHNVFNQTQHHLSNPLRRGNSYRKFCISPTLRGHRADT